ncbi:MAG TPA: hypothetical protein VF707_04460 [Ardenticatenaceae bacterium]
MTNRLRRFLDNPRVAVRAWNAPIARALFAVALVLIWLLALGSWHLTDRTPSPHPASSTAGPATFPTLLNRFGMIRSRWKENAPCSDCLR